MHSQKLLTKITAIEEFQRKNAAAFTNFFNALMLPVGIGFVYSFILTAGRCLRDNDFVIYTLAAQAIRNGEDPYAVFLPQVYPDGLAVNWRYIYPPFIATLLSLFLILGTAGAKIMWAVLTTAGISTAAFTLRRLRMVESLGVGWIVIAFSLWPVAIDGFEQGQVDGMVLGLLATFLLAMHHKYPKVAGLALALAVHVKVTPIIFAVLLLDRQYVRVRIPFIVSLVGVAACVALAGGIAPWLYFILSASETASGGAEWLSPANHAISKSLFLLCPALGMRAALWIQHALVAWGALVVARECRADGRRCLDRDFCRLTVLMFIASPIVWFHHALWLVFAIVWCWNHNTSIRSRTLIAVLVVTISLGRYIGPALCGRDMSELDMFEPLQFLLGAVSLWVLLGRGVLPGQRRVIPRPDTAVAA
jgi:hypothetical protein